MENNKNMLDEREQTRYAAKVNGKIISDPLLTESAAWDAAKQYISNSDSESLKNVSIDVVLVTRDGQEILFG